MPLWRTPALRACAFSRSAWAHRLAGGRARQVERVDVRAARHEQLDGLQVAVVRAADEGRLLHLARTSAALAASPNFGRCAMSLARVMHAWPERQAPVQRSMHQCRRRQSPFFHAGRCTHHADCKHSQTNTLGGGWQRAAPRCAARCRRPPPSETPCNSDDLGGSIVQSMGLGCVLRRRSTSPSAPVGVVCVCSLSKVLFACTAQSQVDLDAAGPGRRPAESVRA